MGKSHITYTMRFNRSKRTYTIRKYINKVCVAKYRRAATIARIGRKTT